MKHNEFMPRARRPQVSPIRQAAERMAAERGRLGITNPMLQDATRRPCTDVGTVLSKLTREGKLFGATVPGHLRHWFSTQQLANDWAAATAPKPKPEPTPRQRMLPTRRGLPAPVTLAPTQRVGEPIITERTRHTIDRTQRPNSRIEAAPPPPPDPRWPSFASMRPGTDPTTGKAWGAAA